MNNMLPRRSVCAALVLCLGALLVAAPAGASTPPDRLASLTISIWLEYDRPGALCIYAGELPTDTPLPARLTFRLPTQPSSTAAIDAEGKFRYIRPVVTEERDSSVVNYEVSWPRFQVEYYNDSLAKQGAGRELDYVYRADYPIEQLVLEAKEPFGARDFTLDPAADTQSQGEDGLTVYRRTIGPVAPGQEVRWRVSYAKGDPRLAAEALGLPTPEASPYEASPSSAAQPAGRFAAWALVGIFGLTVFGGLGLVVGLGRRTAHKPAPARARARSGGKRGERTKPAKARPAAPKVRLAKYCHECGAPLAKDNTYCRKCGTRRRGA